MFSLKDKVALVTGASQGIGRATALALAEAGAKVAVAARNAEKLASLVGEIEAAGGAALAVPMDVADGAQVKAGFQQVLEKFGRLDILVNNAAITRDGLALRMKLEDWEAVLRTNFTGAHLCIQQALGAMMKQRSGRIINVTSVVAETGNAGQANYVASKAGLIGLDARDCRGSGVAQHHGECRRAGLHRNADDRSALARAERGDEGADSAGAVWARTRDRRGDRFSRQRRSRLHHRASAGRQRRHAHGLSARRIRMRKVDRGKVDRRAAHRMGRYKTGADFAWRAAQGPSDHQ